MGRIGALRALTVYLCSLWPPITVISVCSAQCTDPVYVLDLCLSSLYTSGTVIYLQFSLLIYRNAICFSRMTASVTLLTLLVVLGAFCGPHGNFYIDYRVA